MNTFRVVLTFGMALGAVGTVMERYDGRLVCIALFAWSSLLYLASLAVAP